MKSTLIKCFVTGAILAINPGIALAIDETFTLSTDPGKDFGKSFTLEAGTYTLTHIAKDGQSALNYWSNSKQEPVTECNDNNPGKCKQGWTTYFSIFSPVYNNGQPKLSTDGTDRYKTPEEAIKAAKPFTFEIKNKGAVLFYVHDNVVDNNGGITLRLTGGK